jgi:hypothetical protein
LPISEPEIATPERPSPEVAAGPDVGGGHPVEPVVGLDRQVDPGDQPLEHHRVATGTRLDVLIDRRLEVLDHQPVRPAEQLDVGLFHRGVGGHDRLAVDGGPVAPFDPDGPVRFLGDADGVGRAVPAQLENLSQADLDVAGRRQPVLELLDPRAKRHTLHHVAP